MNVSEAKRRILRMLQKEVKLPRDWSSPLLLTCMDIGNESGCYTPLVGRDEVFAAVKSDMKIAGYRLEKITISKRVHYRISRKQN